MKGKFTLTWVLVTGAVLFVGSAYAQDGRPHDLAALKSELAKAVEAGELTKEQAVQKYDAVADQFEGSKKESQTPDLSAFTGKLKALVAEGKLTEAEAKDLYMSVISGDASKDPRPQKQGVKGSDYKVKSLEETQKLSASLPTTSTAGDQEGPI